MSVQSIIDQYGVAMTQYGRVTAVDATGAITMSYDPVADTIKVLLQPANPNESKINGAIRMSTPTTAYCSVDVSIANTDRLVYGSNTYEVTGIRSPDLRVSPDVLAYRILTLITIEGNS